MKFFPFDIHYSLFDILRFYLLRPGPLDPLNPRINNVFEMMDYKGGDHLLVDPS